MEMVKKMKKNNKLKKKDSGGEWENVFEKMIEKRRLEMMMKRWMKKK